MKLTTSIIARTLTISLIAFVKIILSAEEEEKPKTTLAIEDLVLLLNSKDTDRLDAKAPPSVCGNLYQSKDGRKTRCSSHQWKSLSRNWQITEMRNSPTYMKIMAYMLKN